MCGLVGVFSVNNLSMPKERWFRDALYIDGLRGMDSVGVLKLDSQFKKSMVKRAMYPSDFLDLKPVDKLWQGQNRMFIGHNRWATKGAVNNANAHPFQHGHITMVHNGSLFTYSSLTGSEQFEVDSEAICYSIYKDGAEETIKKLNGSFSLIWWDDKEKTLNFCRNSERPMYFAAADSDATCLFASEPEMISWLASGKERKSKFIHKDPTATDVGVLYTFDIGAKEGSKKLTTLGLESKRVELYTPPARSYEDNWKHGNRASQKDAQRRRNARRGTVSHLPRAKDKRPTQPADEKLQQYGLVRGDEIKFNYLTHEEVGGSSGKCIIEAYMPNFPYLPVKVFNVDLGDFSFDDGFIAQVVSMIKTVDQTQPEVVVSSSTMERAVPFTPDWRGLFHLLQILF